jgi:hypothetical protein
MHQSVEGIYRGGKIELLEQPPDVVDGPVIVTFLSAPVQTPKEVDLASRGIDEEQAASLRQRLAAFAEDWLRPEMDVYDAL